VEELTQPQGHSTSGSHERYKSPERLQWEREWDCLVKMRSWILENGLLTLDEMEELEESSRKYVSDCRLQSWKAFEEPILEQKHKAVALIEQLAAGVQDEQLHAVYQELKNNPVPFRRDIMSALFRSMHFAGNGANLQEVRDYYEELKTLNKEMFNSHLHLSKEQFTEAVLPELHFDEDAPMINGYEILNRYFDALFSANNQVVAFGEDVGKIGDVNQGFAGLQNKHGRERIFDTGIRELTIIGQGVGMAMRGLRPIAEIQYLDYLLYGITILSDDAASLHYRSAGTQVAPIIVRTRGHRLEGIWHSGSPMGLLINALKGFRLCVPRNMLQAVGFYNALLAEKEPGVVIESLNGYRLKEKLPSSLLNYVLPLGIPEVMREGNDLTIVSYGSTLRIVLEAAEMLASLNIDVEVLDVQTLMPFDVQNKILESLKKTNRIMFVDEDVPGGATSFMYADVMDRQGGYRWLDASARILCAHPHRPAYGSDGDYFSKPNMEDIVALAIEVMAE
jgi:pyruvate/2-oxoglutarate/acetoin dehydrogenase E1 component